jgi:hypothetical protein
MKLTAILKRTKKEKTERVSGEPYKNKGLEMEDR